MAAPRGGSLRRMKIAAAAALTLHGFAFAAEEFRFTSGLGIAVPAPRAAHTAFITA